MAEEIICKRNPMWIGLCVASIIIFLFVRGSVTYNQGDLKPDNLAMLFLISIFCAIIFGSVYLICYKQYKIIGKKYIEKEQEEPKSQWIEVKGD